MIMKGSMMKNQVFVSIPMNKIYATCIISAVAWCAAAQACSPRLDGEPTYCPPWDDVLVKEFEETIKDESFDEEFPEVFTHTVTLYDTRTEYETAHMGHSFPTTGEWIEKIRDHEAQKDRISIEEMLNNTLTEYEDGSDGSTE